MDSDDDGFPKQGGEALQIDNEFDDSEEEGDENDDFNDFGFAKEYRP